MYLCLFICVGFVQSHVHSGTQGPEVDIEDHLQLFSILFTEAECLPEPPSSLDTHLGSWIPYLYFPSAEILNRPP